MFKLINKQDILGFVFLLSSVFIPIILEGCSYFFYNYNNFFLTDVFGPFLKELIDYPLAWIIFLIGVYFSFRGSRKKEKTTVVGVINLLLICLSFFIISVTNSINVDFGPIPERNIKTITNSVLDDKTSFNGEPIISCNDERLMDIPVFKAFTQLKERYHSDLQKNKYICLKEHSSPPFAVQELFCNVQRDSSVFAVKYSYVKEKSTIYCVDDSGYKGEVDYMPTSTSCQ